MGAEVRSGLLFFVNGAKKTLNETVWQNSVINILQKVMKCERRPLRR